MMLPMQTAFVELSREIYTVTRLVREARDILQANFPMLWVEGEISNLARPPSGHVYFTLKDRHCQVRCAMFRSRNNLLVFTPEDGMHVLVRGRVSLYEGRGEFQVVIEQMEPAGEGALRLALEQLKRRLAAEGLFAGEHKKALPMLPQCIGIVTSPSGAVVRDILSVLRRRFPATPVVVYPVPVQGKGAAQRIAQVIKLADRRRDCDVLILARGGGSLEDLWAFNEEVVARAIFDCQLPIVCGVGHEIDFTVADFVADLRAPTPSAAAELVSSDQAAMMERLAATETLLTSRMRSTLSRARETVDLLARRVLHPGRRLQDLAQRIDDLSQRMNAMLRVALQTKATRLMALSGSVHQCNPLDRIGQLGSQCAYLHQRSVRAAGHFFAGLTGRLANLTRALDAVSPLATLERGYAIVTKLPEGPILRRAAQVSSGDRVSARLAHGRLICRVQEILRDDPDALASQDTT